MFCYLIEAEWLICISRLVDNGLLPVWSKAIFWTNAGLLLIRPLGTNSSENWIKIHFSITCIRKIYLKNIICEMASVLSLLPCVNKCNTSRVNSLWLVTPSGVIDLSQHWLRIWLVAWRHQAITWANVDLSVSQITFTWGQFHKRYSSHQSLKFVWKSWKLLVFI